MGTWGRAILADDFTRDVYDDFVKCLIEGVESNKVIADLQKKFVETLTDRDESPLLWLAIAKAQWDYGISDSDVLARVDQDIAQGNGLDRWIEQGDSVLEKRKAALISFQKNIHSVNPNPKKRKKPRGYRAIFQRGDCLSVDLKDGSFGAALVLAVKEEGTALAANLIIALGGAHPSSPGIPIFEKRNWLKLTHHSWKGDLAISWYLARYFSKQGGGLVKIGNIPLRASDPKGPESYSSWDLLATKIFQQQQWDLGKR